jgi:hypothetical protein
MPTDSGNSEEELVRFAAAEIDGYALSTQLRHEGTKSFVNSCNDRMV